MLIWSILVFVFEVCWVVCEVFIGNWCLMLFWVTKIVLGLERGGDNLQKAVIV